LQEKVKEVYKFVTHNPIDFLEEFIYKEPNGVVARKVAKRIMKENKQLEKK